MLPGLYHCIGVQHGGSAVYRQEPSEEVNSEQLFMYYYHKGVGAGWYFAKQYLEESADEWVAYCATAPMGRLHVPWWNKEFMEGAQLMSYGEFADMQITLLQQELEAKQAELAEGTC